MNHCLNSSKSKPSQNQFYDDSSLTRAFILLQLIVILLYLINDIEHSQNIWDHKTLAQFDYWGTKSICSISWNGLTKRLCKKSIQVTLYHIWLSHDSVKKIAEKPIKTRINYDWNFLTYFFSVNVGQMSLFVLIAN